MLCQLRAVVAPEIFFRDVIQIYEVDNDLFVNDIFLFHLNYWDEKMTYFANSNSNEDFSSQHEFFQIINLNYIEDEYCGIRDFFNKKFIHDTARE